MRPVNLGSRIDPPTTPETGTRVRAALERIGASPHFHTSPALVAFLAFVVEEALAGRGNQLKAYTVATLGLGRGADFNPQTDAIVRTEARRLRRALVAYYADAGRDDPVRIVLPLGCYAPRFVVQAATRSDGREDDRVAAEGCAHTVPASAYLTYVARFFLGARGAGWPPAPPRRDGLREPMRLYVAA